MDLKAGRVDEAELVFLRPEIQAQIAHYVVNFGDVIISIAGSIGLVAPVPATLDGVNLTENAAKLVPLRGVEFDAVFLAAYLQTPHAQSQIKSHVGQVTIGKLALFRIEKIKVPLPALALQCEFVLRVSALRDHDTVLRRAQLELDALFASLQQRAFPRRFVAVRGELIGVWAETWREIWLPLIEPSLVEDDEGLPEYIFCELYRALAPALSSPPSVEDLADIIGNPVQSREAFEATTAYDLAGERALVGFFEAMHDALEEMGGDESTNRYFNLLSGFIDKFSLRYDLRRPCMLCPTLPGVFASLVRDLRRLRVRIYTSISANEGLRGRGEDLRTGARTPDQDVHPEAGE